MVHFYLLKTVKTNAWKRSFFILNNYKITRSGYTYKQETDMYFFAISSRVICNKLIEGHIPETSS